MNNPYGEEAPLVDPADLPRLDRRRGRQSTDH